MKANEFVKEHGVKKTKIICDRYFDYTHVANDARMLISEKDYVEFAPHFKSSLSDAVKISDLKRLVESHDLVEKVGGMDKAKMLLRMRIAAELYESADEIEKAIADVESCMEVS